MEKEKRLYQIIFWDKNDDTKPGQRLTVFANVSDYFVG